MKVVLDCIPCYLKQAINTMAQTDVSEQQATSIIYETMPLISLLDPESTPAENSTLVLKKVNELLRISDPFVRAKKESNELAISLLPCLRAKIAESPDPLYMALQIAVAGNIIDMGILKDFDVEESIREALAKRFSCDEYPIFLNKLHSATEVLILGDNSGEIVFDKLLAEQLNNLGLKVFYAVKGAPILNDATLIDAEEVGMHEFASVVSNGSGFLGTILKDCSEEFKTVYCRSDLVISKGQANYESLEGTESAGDRLFFLLRSKCDVVAASLDVKLGEMVFCRKMKKKNQVDSEN